MSVKFTYDEEKDILIIKEDNKTTVFKLGKNKYDEIFKYVLRSIDQLDNEPPTPEPPEDPKKPFYGFIFYIDDESEEVVNLYDENDNIIDEEDIYPSLIPAYYEVVTPDPNGRPKYWVASGDIIHDKTWGYYGIRVGANYNYYDFGKGKEVTNLILNTQDTSSEYNNSIWKSLAEYNASNVHGNDWFIGNEQEMNQLYSYYGSQGISDNIFDGGSNDFVGCSLEEYDSDHLNDYDETYCVLYQPSDGNYGHNWVKNFSAKWMYLRTI